MKKIATGFLVLIMSSAAFAMHRAQQSCRFSSGDMLVIKQGDHEYEHFHQQLNLSLYKHSMTFKIAYDQKDKTLVLSLDATSPIKEARLGLPNSDSAELSQNNIFIFKKIPDLIEIKEKSSCLALIVAETKVLFTLTGDEIKKLIY